MSFPYKLTLWLWPSGLYPLAVVHYLKARALPPSILAQISIIPSRMTATGIEQSASHAPRPEGTSLPCLRVHDMTTGAEHLVTQTPAILETLAALIPPAGNGGDVFIAARARDINTLFCELLLSAGFHVRHAQAKTLAWSGMQAHEQSAGAAADALREVRRRGVALNAAVVRAKEAGRGPFIAGTHAASIADGYVAGGVGYMRRNYGLDVFEEFPVLQEWFEAYMKSEACASEAEIDKLEQGESLAWAYVAGTLPST